MNPDLGRLEPYPFQHLATLLDGVTPAPGLASIRLSIGEPKHPTPGFILEALSAGLPSLAGYPATQGGADLRLSIADWLCRRFHLPASAVDPARNVLPVNGSREALFAIAQCVVDRGRNPLVLMPNPFYQIYEGAALLAGAEPRYLNCAPENHWQPDFEGVPEADWQRCQLLYICTPGNPTGTTLPETQLQWLIEQAERYDFVIASDECYSEIYRDEDQPPCGLLQAAADMGNTDFRRCLVFNSLSKRSNAPGLRSGLVAGDAEILSGFLRYRTYHGCTMSPPIQTASAAAWRDEQHVRANRHAYREKFAAALEVLDPHLELAWPDGGFYLWPKTPIEDTAFARGLFEQQAVTVLPGSYLSRAVDGRNPGRNRLRVALVPPLAECIEAAQRIATYVQTL